MRQVVYLTSHAPHLPYLAVSLHTLRKWWDGEVKVFSWKESYDITKRMADDPRLRITAHLIEPGYRGRNDQFLSKIRLMQTLDANVSLYLDADTMIAGPVEPLLVAAESCPFVATQFNDWWTDKPMVRRRIAHLAAIPEIDQALVSEITKGEMRYVSVNGGVFACQPHSRVLPLWEKWTLAAIKDVFIADEAVLHLMQLAFKPDEYRMYLGGRYNCSPIVRYRPEKEKTTGIRIWHFHGDSNVRPGKSQEGFAMWWPVYVEVLEQNIGYIQEWNDQCVRANRWMRGLKKSGVSFTSHQKT